MRGVPGFRRHPGMRELPQPGRPDGSRGFASVPWLHEGRSRRGLGPAGTHGRERFGCGVTDVPCLPWARTLPGGAMPSPRMQRAASSGAFLPGASPEAPQGAASSRTALGRSQAPLSACSRQLFPASRPGAQARRRRPAAATCRHGAQASSLARSGPQSEASGLVTTRRPATGNRRKVLIHNVERRFRVGRRGWNGRVPSGADVQPQDFLRKIHSAPMTFAIRQRIGTGGCLLELGGCCISVLYEHKQMPLWWRC